MTESETKNPTLEEKRKKKFPWGKIALVLAGIGTLIVLGRWLGGYLPEFAKWVEALGPTGVLVFILGYAIATVAFAPGSLLTLAAGAIFGLLWGTIYVFFAATLGASAAFLVARYLARRAIEKKLKGNTKFAAIDKAVGEQGLKIVLLLRLSPIFPFNLLNYALGLTKVRFLDYFVASLGMIPGTLLYVYYGKVAGDLATITSGVVQERGAGDYTVLALGLAAAIIVTTIVTRIARKALRSATETG